MTESYPHFKDKDAISHVVEAQSRGLISAAEIHGIETPGFISSLADTARDTAMILLLIAPFLMLFEIQNAYLYSAFFLVGWIVWRFGRAAQLGWARLERLHRVLEQEKWEIEHNRPQERDELRELYRAKGFDGKLLEDVLDVLMADGDRLLKVMIEEELGLSLENVEHPLKQGLGAAIGGFIAASFIISALYFWQSLGLIITSLIMVGCAGGILAYFAQNRLIPAIIWNSALGLFSFGLTYYIIQIFL